MSRKVDTFRTVISQPQPLSNFIVWMPIAPTSVIVCTECDLPQENYAEDVININGQPVYIPTRDQVNGAWDCTFDESVIPVSAPTVAMLKGLVNSNQMGEIVEDTKAYFDKHVRMLFTNNPVKVAKNFKKLTTFIPVQDIVVTLLRMDMVVGNNSVFNLSLGIPSCTIILKDAWLQTIQPIMLGADKATTPLKYRLKFRYSAIKSAISI